VIISAAPEDEGGEELLAALILSEQFASRRALLSININFFLKLND